MVSDANSGYSTWRRWLQDVFPASESPKPKLIPEIEPTFLSEGDSWARSCFKSEENHPRYIPITDLQLHQLPDGWRHQQVLSDVQAVGRRVVKLTVKKRSSARAGAPRPGGHVGTGFVTFHPRWGAVVHTCKHVVFDCFEADNTMVTFFYDKEVSGGTSVLKCPGSSRHFRSVWSMDYSSFALALPMQEFFPLTDDRVDDRFAWRNFSLSRLLYRQKNTVDVLIISHPHGRPKQVSFGKLTRRHSMVPVMYDAPTCPGSSGAPVVRLSADHAIYLTAGQFLHHGHYHSRVSLGMGQLRPPLTLPYWRPLDSPRLRRVRYKGENFPLPRPQELAEFTSHGTRRSRLARSSSPGCRQQTNSQNQRKRSARDSKAVCAQRTSGLKFKGENISLARGSGSGDSNSLESAALPLIQFPVCMSARSLFVHAHSCAFVVF
ncbi:uncharacterized protein LOC112561160 isoform X2 [Pomacea canaliculata]|uniref:uncharacterized protein LOC112561160 isoform X2 n=1 Tax=Pomacea canaliculata TaxID=400727 RepID=UPI000D73045F|nr:uncharacterized protein LOC112561160 isoform X2 [Pomacea canaliculata]